MVGDREPDGMQSFYQRREEIAAGPPDPNALDSLPTDLGPPLPEWKVNWGGVGALVALVLALAVASRVFGASVAVIAGVGLLVSAAIWTMAQGPPLLHQAGDVGVGGDLGTVGSGMDCGDFGGGGDC